MRKERIERFMKNRKNTIYLVLAGLCAIAACITFGWRYYMKTIERNELGKLLHAEEYSRHYVMIPEDSSSALWQDMYRSAKKAAAEADAYVELLADWSAGEYSMDSYVDIAVAAKADGIIVKPDGTAAMRKSIRQADEAGIPVVAVLDDDTGSDRKSFVGVNSYQMGTTYGRQILSCIDDATRRITVLLRRGDSSKDLIFKELKATVESGLTQEQSQKIMIDPLTILANSTFDAEEVIRDLFNQENHPDILVCMNETDSASAYHAMVDYNRVGSVDLIGYYQSPTMLEAVEKGTVPMVVTLDTQQMGRSCIEALEEYHSMGYVSDYISVDPEIITRRNVSQFAEKESGGDR